MSLQEPVDTPHPSEPENSGDLMVRQALAPQPVGAGGTQRRRFDAWQPGPATRLLEHVTGCSIAERLTRTTRTEHRTGQGFDGATHRSGERLDLSIARVIEPAVATNIEPPKRLHP